MEVETRRGLGDAPASKVILNMRMNEQKVRVIIITFKVLFKRSNNNYPRRYLIASFEGIPYLASFVLLHRESR